MLAKFLAVEEAISIAPHSTAEVKLQDADLSNVGFIFPATETAARWLLLANAGLLLWPAKAFVYNSKDVTQNIARGECIAINVKLEEEGLKMGEIQAPVENDSSEAESETNESSENASVSEATETETDASPEEAEMVTDPNEVEGSEPDAESEESTEENADADEVASTETDESPEEKEEEEEVVEETPKKSSRSKK